MNPLRTAGRWLDAFFAPQPMHAMVICRVVLGLTLLFCYAADLPWVQQVYGPDGLGGFAFYRHFPGSGPGRSLEAPAHWLHLVESPGVVWGLYALLLASALAFAAGFRARGAGLLLFLLHSLFHARNYTAFYGWAVMIKPFLLYVALSDADRFGSLDAWLRRRREGTAAAPAAWIGPGWPVRLLQVHVCAMYAAAGLQRLTAPQWSEGKMMLVMLHDRLYGRFDIDWRPLEPLLQVGTWVAWLAEPIGALTLWIPGVGQWVALVLMALHAGLELISNTGWWQTVMICALTTFLPARWLALLPGLPATPGPAPSDAGPRS